MHALHKAYSIWQWRHQLWGTCGAPSTLEVYGPTPNYNVGEQKQGVSRTHKREGAAAAAGSIFPYC